MDDDDDGGNLFTLGSAMFYIRNDSQNLVYAQGNDWGESNGAVIDDRLYDDDENNNVGPINFYPFEIDSLFPELKLKTRAWFAGSKG